MRNINFVTASWIGLGYVKKKKKTLMHTRQMPQRKKISTAFVSNIRIVKFRTQNTINQNDRNQQTKLANNRWSVQSQANFLFD